ncbi:hypothetical protein H0H87_005963 [Tephrocybe sp. NHM501043]|nr:hypothetical protein H0H87_005963 [Tephrocybe sp. NHM501043]
MSFPPPAPLQSRLARPLLVGPDAAPASPFPILLHGPVQRGFGRGSKDLGCPTANLPDDAILPMTSVAQNGVYYGYAQISPNNALTPEDTTVLPMVMSLGWNPYYKNERLTAEIHIMHDFQADFYGLEMRAVVLGYIRPELDYISREALIDDINTDKRVALNSLSRPAYQAFAHHPHFQL